MVVMRFLSDDDDDLLTIYSSIFSEISRFIDSFGTQNWDLGWTAKRSINLDKNKRTQN